MSSLDPGEFRLEFSEPPPPPPPPKRPRVTLSAEDKLARRRQRFLREFAGSPNLVLFHEVHRLLGEPLGRCAEGGWLREDVGAVVPAKGDVEEGTDTRHIAHQPWGPEWVSACGLSWSVEAVRHLQVQLFYRSMAELTLRHNESEKWSVLKWIMAPALVRRYVFDARLGRSHCLVTHERDHPFSFHNCCMAARMDEDVIRETVRRYTPAPVLEAVDQVCTY